MIPASPVAPTPLIEEPRRVSRPGTYQSIQALRGIAAIIVAIFHAGLRYDPSQSTFRVGNAGVDIFFVISGFVIWTVTVRRPASPLVFLKHRFVRLVPMYWIVTLAMVMGATLVPSAFPNMHITWPDVLLSMAFLPHLSPSTGTFEPVLGQGWTLNFEVFFYLVFALVLLLPLRARFRAIVAALVILPVLGEAVMTPSVPPTWLLNPLLIEFLGGLCIARLAAGDWRPRAAWCWASVVFGFAGLMAASPAGGDDLARVLQYGVPAFLVVGGAVGLEAAGKLQVPKFLQVLGAASYSIYLTHTFAISILGKIWPGSFPPWGFITLATLLAIMAGIAAYALLENPMLAVMRGKRLPTMSTLFVPS
jgi:exopolysaccharide production protein ExoZ